MKLQDIFDQLTFGEFAQLSIGGEDAGVINEKNWSRVLAHVNLGLVALHTRFFIKEDRIKLKLQPGQISYMIKSQFAVNNRRSKAPVKYLEDTEYMPFGDNVIKIEKVITDSGFEMPLNNLSNPMSVSTPSLLVLRVPDIILPGAAGQRDLPDDLKTERLELVYRANHPLIVQPIGYFDPSRVEIDLPDTYMTALLYWVASRVHAPVGMVNEFNASNSYYAKYLAEIELLEGYGVVVDRAEGHTRFQRNGWV